MTIKAVGTKDDMTESEMATAIITINYDRVSTPQFSPIAGTYSGPQTITISSSTSGALISCTTDGTDPSPSGGASSPVTISVALSKTLKAIAYKSGWPDSTIGSADYLIQYQLTVQNDGNGTTTPTGTSSQNSNFVISITATPTAGTRPSSLVVVHPH